MKTAYFVAYPRTAAELQTPHLASGERAYEVVKTVVLSAIDYENFITDMSADRQFLEDNAALCAEGPPLRCLLIRRRRVPGGVLVVPDGPGRAAYVRWAARTAEA